MNCGYTLCRRAAGRDAARQRRDGYARALARRAAARAAHHHRARPAPPSGRAAPAVSTNCEAGADGADRAKQTCTDECRCRRLQYPPLPSGRRRHLPRLYRGLFVNFVNIIL